MYLPKYGVTTLTVFDFRDVKADDLGAEAGRDDRDCRPRSVAGPAAVDRPLDGRLAAGVGRARLPDRHLPVALRRRSEDAARCSIASELDLAGLHALQRGGRGRQPDAGRQARRSSATTRARRWCSSRAASTRSWPATASRTQLDRRPLPAQETLAYAPPIADGDRLYLRGERYLYCIGEKYVAALLHWGT